MVAPRNDTETLPLLRMNSDGSRPVIVTSALKTMLSWSLKVSRANDIGEAAHRKEARGKGESSDVSQNENSVIKRIPPHDKCSSLDLTLPPHQPWATICVMNP